MEQIIALLNNRFFVVPLASWGIAQVLKVIINYCITKELNWERLFGDGGMPSGHSATVFSMATMAFLTYGAGSYQFAIAGILAIIVCHDATGVRLETGKQAAVLNEILEAFELLAPDKISEANLKEFVGHTPIQVLAGILLGILNAIVVYFFVL